MPKQYLIEKTKDIVYLRMAYRKLIKLLLIIYLITIVILYKVFIYNFDLNHNDYFIITTFGKLISILPEKS